MRSTVNIIVKDVKKKFRQNKGELTVLNGINTTFEKGGTYAITGVSGIGKSTFLHILAGIDAPSSGTVFYGITNIGAVSAAQKDFFLNQSIGLVFQSPHLISELSVLENIMVPGMIAGRNRAYCRGKALGILQYMGLKSKAESRPDSLSGGQQQRVAIARAIFNKPAFLLADEPTGNLDRETGKKIVDLLLQCKNEWGMGIIISSHDPYIAKKMDVVFRLQNGRLTQM